MKAVFGVLSLLIVLAIVGLVAKRQLRADGVIAARQNAAASQAAAWTSGDGPTDTTGVLRANEASGAQSVAQQARTLQQQIRDETARTLQQGADRTDRAAP